MTKEIKLKCDVCGKYEFIKFDLQLLEKMEMTKFFKVNLYEFQHICSDRCAKKVQAILGEEKCNIDNLCAREYKILEEMEK
jgi:hypothetical protein